MTDLAAEHALAFGEAFGSAVDVIGISTGGSIALQTAVDRPSTVSRLVLIGSACRLSDGGRALQRVYARRLISGAIVTRRPRRTH
jgi:pimeloyl-ACP methyl ester carboxylesterase